MFSLSTILLTAYWNIDSTYGRKWSYICGIYKDYIGITDLNDSRKKEIFRLNLCIDILDHAFWNTKQFRVFLRGEFEKYYFFCVNNKEFIDWTNSYKKSNSRSFACLNRFLQEFHKQHVEPILLKKATIDDQIILNFS